MRPRVIKINGALGAMLAGTALSLSGQTTNVWISDFGGEWQDPFNWSLATPGPSNWVYITNAASKTVVIDATTTSDNFSNSLNVARLTLGAPAGFTNTLALTNAGTAVPLHVLGELDLAGGGQLTQTNSRLQVDGLVRLGSSGAAGLTLLSGIAQFGEMNIGEDNAQGALNLKGGTITIPFGSLTVGAGLFSTGLVTIGGGTLLLETNGVVIGGGGAGQLTLLSGTVQAPGLQLGAGDGSQGTLILEGGLMWLSQSLGIGGTQTLPGLVAVSGGTLAVTNTAGSAQMKLGNGALDLERGVVQADGFLLDNPFSTFTNGGGTLRIGGTAQVNGGLLALLGGTNTFAGGLSLGGGVAGAPTALVIANTVVNLSSDLVAAGASNSLAVINISSNAIVNATSGAVMIGAGGTGQMNLFGGNVTVAHVFLGGTAPGSSGTLQLAGGRLKVLSLLSANLIIVDGGDLDGSGGTIIIGQDHDAAMTVSGGSATSIGTMYVGYTSGYVGTYTQSGGVVSVTNTLIVGDCVNGAIGAASVVGGSLFVTNITHNAVLDVRNGTFQLGSGGTLVADVLVLTNPCGHFINSGGSLMVGSMVIDPNLDADGDGMSNTNEFLAGTDPFDPGSNLRIVDVKREGSDVRVTWTTVGGRGYVLQAAPDLVNGPSTPFTDLGPVLIAPGLGAGTVSYLHAGIVNGAPARFYRVRTPALLSADNASDPAYAGTWSSGQNGGVGFGAWTLTVDTSGGGSGGFSIADSSGNGSGASGNINTVGDVAWGMAASAGALADAIRTLNAPLAPGEVVKLDLDTGTINNAAQNGGSVGAGKVGFGLRNGGTDLFEFYFLGGDTQYRIHDLSGTARASGMPFTDGGLHIELTLTGATAYSVTITPNGGSPSTFTGTLAAAGPVDTVRCYNSSAGVGPAHEAYFNSLQVAW